MDSPKTIKWRVEFEEDAHRELKKLDYAIQARISRFLGKLAQEGVSPHSRGKALTGKYGGLWCYRVGDYRIICKPEYHTWVVVVVDIGHRSEIYH